MPRTSGLLVLFLTAAVAVLGVVTWNLYGEVHDRPAARASSPRPAASPEPVADSRRLDLLEQRIAALAARMERVPQERPAPLPGSPEQGGAAVAGSPAGETQPAPQPGDAAMGELFQPRRVAGGGWEFTPEAEEVFLALQRRADQRRRIDERTSFVMQRVARLAETGEIAPLTEATKARVEPIIRKYVAEGDARLQKILRNPEEETPGLTGDQRRDLLRQERDALTQSAQRELEAVLGTADARKIAESSLVGPTGRWRQGGGRGGRGGEGQPAQGE